MTKALSLARVFSRVGYEMHAGQRSIAAAKATHRFRVVCAGRRTGKSTHGGHELTVHAFQAYLRKDSLDPYTNRMEYWIVGPEYSDAEKEFRVVYSDLEKQGFEFDRPGTYYNVGGGDMHISLFGGRFQVHAKSAKYPGTLVGEGLDGVILAEAAKLKPSVWPKYIRPMLVDTRGWALLSSTPEGKNWFYKEFLRAQTSLDYWGVRMPSWTNDKLFPLGADDPELASLAEGLTPELFDQEIAANFAEFVGKVFKDYDDEVHLKRMSYNPAWETYAAVDYGWTNPFVWLLIQVDPFDNVYVIREYYESHKLIDQIPAELRARDLVPANLRVFYPDPASPGDSAVLAEKLKLRIGTNTGGEVEERLRLIRKWLRVPEALEHLPYEHPERKPKLFIDPVMCPKTAYEFGEYRYPQSKEEAKTNEAEKPMKKDDHTPEALGRFFKGHFGEQEAAQGNSRQRRGRTRRR